MNTTEQPAKGNAKTLDIANFLRPAENKTARKSVPAGTKSFSTVLNEKSKAIEEAAGQTGDQPAEGMGKPGSAGNQSSNTLTNGKSQVIGEAAGQTGDQPAEAGQAHAAKQARSTKKDGAAIAHAAKGLSKGKVKLSAPDLQTSQTAQEKTPPTSTEVTDQQEAQATTLQGQSLLAAIPVEVFQNSAAATPTLAADDNGKRHPVNAPAKTVEQPLCETKPTPGIGIGSIQTEELGSKAGSAGIIPDVPKDQQETGPRNTGEGVPAKAVAVAVPSPNLRHRTEINQNPSGDRVLGPSNGRSWGSSGVEQETGRHNMPETVPTNRTVLPSQTMPAEPVLEASPANPPEGIPASAGDNRQSPIIEADGAERQNLSKDALFEAAQKPALQDHGQTLAAGPKVSPDKGNRSFSGDMTGKVTPVQPEPSVEALNRVQTGEDTSAVKETGRPFAEKAHASHDRPDLGQNTNPDRLTSEIRTSGRGSDNVEQATTASINRATLQQGEAALAFAPKATLYVASDTTKKTWDTVKGQKETALSRVSHDTEDSARPVTITRTAPVKETMTVYAAAAEMEKDRPVTWTSKATSEDKMATLAGMKPFGENSPVSGKKIPETDGMSGVKAQALIDQIAEARQQMPNDSGRIKITLTPPNLGTVDLDIIVRQNRVDVIMIADHSDVQQLLQARGEDIKSALQRQDMKIDSYQVLLQSNPDGNQPQTGSWTAMQDHTRNKYASYDSREEEPDDIDILRAVPENLSTHPHNGIVSIFA